MRVRCLLGSGVSNIIIPAAHQAAPNLGPTPTRPSDVADDRPVVTAWEMALAKVVAEDLNAAYPGHMWMVNVENQHIQVRDMMLSGAWGYIIKIPGLYSSSELKRQTLLAGGEILERFKTSRGKYRVDENMGLRVDHAGQHRPEM